MYTLTDKYGNTIRSFDDARALSIAAECSGCAILSSTRRCIVLDGYFLEIREELGV